MFGLEGLARLPWKPGAKRQLYIPQALIGKLASVFFTFCEADGALCCFALSLEAPFGAGATSTMASVSAGVHSGRLMVEYPGLLPAVATCPCFFISCKPTIDDTIVIFMRTVAAAAATL